MARNVKPTGQDVVLRYRYRCRVWCRVWYTGQRCRVVLRRGGEEVVWHCKKARRDVCER